MKNVNMEKIISDYIKYLQEIKNLSPKSIKSYIPVVKEMIKDCKFKTIEDIQNSNVVILQNWLNRKKNEGLSDQSINRRIASCNVLLDNTQGLIPPPFWITVNSPVLGLILSIFNCLSSEFLKAQLSMTSTINLFLIFI